MLSDLWFIYPQYLAMFLLWGNGGATVAQLGDTLDRESSTPSPLARRLEAPGLVRREQLGRDERVVHVHVTAEG